MAKTVARCNKQKDNIRCGIPPIIAFFSETLDLVNYHTKVIVKNCPNCRVDNITERSCLLYECCIHARNNGEFYGDFLFITQIPKAQWNVVYP